MRPTWDEMFMVQAVLAATRGSCLVRYVGAVLVRDKRIIASGYNGAPPGVQTCLESQVCFYQDLAYQDSLKGLGIYEDLKEKRKDFCSAVHAEKNAVNQCSKYGVRADGSILYVTNYPCPGCVRDVIIPNQLSEVVVWQDYLSNPLVTMDEYAVSEYWLKQAKIPVRKLDLSQERLQEIFSLALSVGTRLSYRFDPNRPTQN